MEADATVIKSTFNRLFRKEPLLIRSPGRINLIGEHTDYNDGFVMPAAIDKEITFAVAPSDDGRSSFYSLKYDEHFAIDLNDIRAVAQPRWANYLLGVLFQMVGQGLNVKPFNCAFGGEVPLGAGLSSSAALECGFAFALNELFQLNIPRIGLIRMAQWAEHNFAGVKCGIMDQFASVMGKEGHVLMLDCRSLEYRYLPLDLRDCDIILCDSKVKHALVSSEYNTRREECETGIGILRLHYPKVQSLRDVTSGMLEKHRTEFPGKVFDRCSYVVSEIERVQQAAADLTEGRMEAVGKKMFATHDGLSRLYEVSCRELDFLVEEAKKSDSVLGARMMGGGFGGCTINLVKKSGGETFIQHMRRAYRDEFSIDIPCFPVKIMEGTSVLAGGSIN